MELLPIGRKSCLTLSPLLGILLSVQKPGDHGTLTGGTRNPISVPNRGVVTVVGFPPLPSHKKLTKEVKCKNRDGV